MGKTARIGLCCIISLALAIPAFAGGASSSCLSPSGIAGTVYRGGVGCLERTEGLFSGCLKNAFSLFNPCLDVVKVATNVAFYPLDRSVGYVENCLCKPAASPKAAKVSAARKTKTLR